MPSDSRAGGASASAAASSSSAAPAAAELPPFFTEQQASEIRALLRAPVRDDVKERLRRCTAFLFGAQPLVSLERLRLESDARSSVCGFVWGEGVYAYRCRTCEKTKASALCMECFKHSDHAGHDYLMFRTSGGCCDCGNSRAWAPSGFCSRHHGFTELDPTALPQLLPAALIAAAEIVLPELLHLLLRCASQRDAESVNIVVSWLQHIAKHGDALKMLVVRYMVRAAPAGLAQPRRRAHVGRYGGVVFADGPLAASQAELSAAGHATAGPAQLPTYAPAPSHEGDADNSGAAAAAVTEMLARLRDSLRVNVLPAKSRSDADAASSTEPSAELPALDRLEAQVLRRLLGVAPNDDVDDGDVDEAALEENAEPRHQDVQPSSDAVAARVAASPAGSAGPTSTSTLPRLDSPHQIITLIDQALPAEQLPAALARRDNIISFLGSALGADETSIAEALLQLEDNLPVPVCEELHTLYLILLFDETFKAFFPTLFCVYYRSLVGHYRRHAPHGDGSSRDENYSISKVSIEMFIISPLCLELSRRPRSALLDVLMSCISDLLLECVEPPRASDSGELECVSSASQGIVRQHYWSMMSDLSHVLEHADLAAFMLAERPDLHELWLCVHELLQRFDRQTRRRGSHVEYDDTSGWLSGYLMSDILFTSAPRLALSSSRPATIAAAAALPTLAVAVDRARRFAESAFGADFAHWTATSESPDGRSLAVTRHIVLQALVHLLAWVERWIERQKHARPSAVVSPAQLVPPGVRSALGSDALLLYDVSSLPVSLILPLHRLFAAYVLHGWRAYGGGAGKSAMDVHALLPQLPALAWEHLIEHPMQVVAARPQMLSNAWVRNGAYTFNHASVYGGAFAGESCSDMDLFLLQLAASSMPTSRFVALALMRFATSFFVLPADVLVPAPAAPASSASAPAAGASQVGDVAASAPAGLMGQTGAPHAVGPLAHAAMTAAEASGSAVAVGGADGLADVSDVPAGAATAAASSLSSSSGAAPIAAPSAPPAVDIAQLLPHLGGAELARGDARVRGPPEGMLAVMMRRLADAVADPGNARGPRAAAAGPLPPEDRERMVAQAQAWVRLVVRVARDRTQLSMTQRDFARYSVVQWLCKEDYGFAGLHNHVYRNVVEEPFFEDVVRELADHRVPANASENASCALRAQYWRFFDPFTSLLNATEVQRAQDRVERHVPYAELVDWTTSVPAGFEPLLRITVDPVYLMALAIAVLQLQRNAMPGVETVLASLLFGLRFALRALEPEALAAWPGAAWVVEHASRAEPMPQSPLQWSDGADTDASADASASAWSIAPSWRVMLQRFAVRSGTCSLLGLLAYLARCVTDKAVATLATDVLRLLVTRAGMPRSHASAVLAGEQLGIADSAQVVTLLVELYGTDGVQQTGAPQGTPSSVGSAAASPAELEKRRATVRARQQAMMAKMREAQQRASTTLFGGASPAVAGSADASVDDAASAAGANLLSQSQSQSQLGSMGVPAHSVTSPLSLASSPSVASPTGAGGARVGVEAPSAGALADASVTAQCILCREDCVLGSGDAGVVCSVESTRLGSLCQWEGLVGIEELRARRPSSDVIDVFNGGGAPPSSGSNVYAEVVAAVEPGDVAADDDGEDDDDEDDDGGGDGDLGNDGDDAGRRPGANDDDGVVRPAAPGVGEPAEAMDVVDGALAAVAAAGGGAAAEGDGGDADTENVAGDSGDDEDDEMHDVFEWEAGDDDRAPLVRVLGLPAQVPPPPPPPPPADAAVQREQPEGQAPQRQERARVLVRPHPPQLRRRGDAAAAAAAAVAAQPPHAAAEADDDEADEHAPRRRRLPLRQPIAQRVRGGNGGDDELFRQFDAMLRELRDAAGEPRAPAHHELDELVNRMLGRVLDAPREFPRAHARAVAAVQAMGSAAVSDAAALRQVEVVFSSDEETRRRDGRRRGAHSGAGGAARDLSAELEGTVPDSSGVESPTLPTSRLLDPGASASASAAAASSSNSTARDSSVDAPQSKRAHAAESGGSAVGAGERLPRAQCMRRVVDKVLPFGHGTSPLVASVAEPTATAGLRMRSCGHVLHLSCFSRYMASLQQRGEALYYNQWLQIEAGEFRCPLCRAISNMVMPIDLGLPLAREAPAPSSAAGAAAATPPAVNDFEPGLHPLARGHPLFGPPPEAAEPAQVPSMFRRRAVDASAAAGSSETLLLDESGPPEHWAARIFRRARDRNRLVRGTSVRATVRLLLDLVPSACSTKVLPLGTLATLAAGHVALSGRASTLDSGAWEQYQRIGKELLRMHAMQTARSAEPRLSNDTVHVWAMAALLEQAELVSRVNEDTSPACEPLEAALQHWEREVAPLDFSSRTSVLFHTVRGVRSLWALWHRVREERVWSDTLWRDLHAQFAVPLLAMFQVRGGVSPSSVQWDESLALLASELRPSTDEQVHGWSRVLRRASSLVSSFASLERSPFAVLVQVVACAPVRMDADLVLDVAEVFEMLVVAQTLVSTADEWSGGRALLLSKLAGGDASAVVRSLLATRDRDAASSSASSSASAPAVAASVVAAEGSDNLWHVAQQRTSAAVLAFWRRVALLLGVIEPLQSGLWGESSTLLGAEMPLRALVRGNVQTAGWRTRLQRWTSTPQLSLSMANWIRRLYTRTAAVSRTESCMQVLSARPLRLMDLPKDYHTLFERFMQLRCPSCNAHVERAFVCLVTGRVLLESGCCNAGFSTVASHVSRVGVVCPVLDINTSIVRLYRRQQAIVWGSLYVDKNGEEDRGLRRGRALMLNAQRVRKLWSDMMTQQYDMITH